MQIRSCMPWPNLRIAIVVFSIVILNPSLPWWKRPGWGMLLFVFNDSSSWLAKKKKKGSHWRMVFFSWEWTLYLYLRLDGYWDCSFPRVALYLVLTKICYSVRCYLVTSKNCFVATCLSFVHQLLPHDMYQQLLQALIVPQHSLQMYSSLCHLSCFLEILRYLHM